MLTREQLQEAVDTLAECGGVKSKAAGKLGIDPATLRWRLARAARIGLTGYKPVLEGFEISKISTDRDGDVISVTQKPEHGDVYTPPPAHLLGKVTVNLDAEGRVIQSWPRYMPDTANALALVEHLKHAFDDYASPHLPVALPPHSEDDFLNFIPCNDWHVNLLTWSREVGENWDLKIAERVIGHAIETAIKRSRRAGVAVVLGGGDLMHNDDNTNRTAKSHNVLDADGRHAKGIEVAQRLKVRAIDCALENNDSVIVRILAGNHDEYSSVAIAHYLKAYYRNEPRVTVDTDQSLFWFYRFGLVMLAATHGHMVKLGEMPGIMAHRRAEMWGATRFRYAHGFHVHHLSKVATEGNGVICESHQAPIPQDSWHYGSGYLSGRSVKVITYHKSLGYYTEQREPILDAGDAYALRVAA
jgi:hypothetical protein